MNIPAVNSHAHGERFLIFASRYISKRLLKLAFEELLIGAGGSVLLRLFGSGLFSLGQGRRVLA